MSRHSAYKAWHSLHLKTGANEVGTSCSCQVQGRRCIRRAKHLRSMDQQVKFLVTSNRLHRGRRDVHGLRGQNLQLAQSQTHFGLYVHSMDTHGEAFTRVSYPWIFPLSHEHEPQSWPRQTCRKVTHMTPSQGLRHLDMLYWNTGHLTRVMLTWITASTVFLNTFKQVTDVVFAFRVVWFTAVTSHGGSFQDLTSQRTQAWQVSSRDLYTFIDGVQVCTLGLISWIFVNDWHLSLL